MLGDLGKHSGADFIPIMKGEDVILPALPLQGAVRTFLAVYSPTQTKQGSENLFGFG